MTNGRSGRTASWVGAVVSIVLLVGSGATAYSNLNSAIVDGQTRDELRQVQVDKLDEYDARVSEDVDELGDKMIRLEADLNSTKRTIERLEFALNEILKEMKQMNENLIRMDK